MGRRRDETVRGFGPGPIANDNQALTCSANALRFYTIWHGLGLRADTVTPTTTPHGLTAPNPDQEAASNQPAVTI
jgi:hypothetical protein